MYCPNCGKSDQTENTYCRQCGEFLPDFSKKNKPPFGGNTPEEQITTNLYLNFLSGTVSLILSTVLYANFGFRSGTSPIIYIVGAFLLAMCGWQFSTFVIGLKLKKNFSNRRVDLEMKNQQTTEIQFESAKTQELLNEADFTDVVPTSVTENTTRQLSKEKIKNTSPQSEH